jgi:hypothetical protein
MKVLNIVDQIEECMIAQICEAKKNKGSEKHAKTTKL